MRGYIYKSHNTITLYYNKLKHRVQVGLAQQSMNRDTLRLIQRDNIFTNEQ